MTDKLEKVYEKIDEKLGDEHIRELIANLMNVENDAKAMEKLIELHKQCKNVFEEKEEAPKVPIARNKSIDRKIRQNRRK